MFRATETLFRAPSALNTQLLPWNIWQTEIWSTRHHIISTHTHKNSTEEDACTHECIQDCIRNMKSCQKSTSLSLFPVKSLPVWQRGCGWFLLYLGLIKKIHKHPTLKLFQLQIMLTLWVSRTWDTVESAAYRFMCSYSWNRPCLGNIRVRFFLLLRSISKTDVM